MLHLEVFRCIQQHPAVYTNFSLVPSLVLQPELCHDLPSSSDLQYLSRKNMWNTKSKPAAGKFKNQVLRARSKRNDRHACTPAIQSS